MENVKPISGIYYSTGGGCYCAEGKTSDGNYFMIDLNSRDVTIVNENPSDMENSWTMDWIEAHLVGYFVRESELAETFIYRALKVCKPY